MKQEHVSVLLNFYGHEMMFKWVGEWKDWVVLGSFQLSMRRREVAFLRSTPKGTCCLLVPDDCPFWNDVFLFTDVCESAVCKLLVLEKLI